MRKIRQARVRVSTPAAPLGDIQNYAADEGRGYTQAQAQQPHLAKFELPRCARRSYSCGRAWAAPWQSAFVAQALCVQAGGAPHSSEEFRCSPCVPLCLCRPATERHCKLVTVRGCWTGVKPKI